MIRLPLVALRRTAIAALLLALIGCASELARVENPASNGPVPPASASSTPAASGANAAATANSAAPAKPDSGEPLPESVPVPIAGSELVHGRSTVKVAAPIAKVREAVLDFAHYAEFMPHYQSCRVLGRTAGGARDVYMEVEALSGAVKMWAEIEMPKPTPTPDGYETMDSTFVKGNVRDFKAVWRMRALDPSTTELSLEVFLHPFLPMPTGLMNGENLSGAAKGVSAMRKHAEQMAAAK